MFVRKFLSFGVSFGAALVCFGGAAYAVDPTSLSSFTRMAPASWSSYVHEHVPSAWTAFANAAPQPLGYEINEPLQTAAISHRLRIPRAATSINDVCPDNMALVAGQFCMDRYEASTVLLDDQDRVIGPHSPYELVNDKRVRAESKPGVKPQGYISQTQAAAACRLAGKRLCTDKEWVAACKGAERWDYPYGPNHEPDRCNDSERPGLWKNGALPHASFRNFDQLNDPLMNQLYGLAKTGSFSGCKTREGIFDLIGNLYEWTADPSGTFRGGYYRNARERGPSCTYATDTHAPTYHDYSTGFRCCAEAKR
jgi:formylglycine-generating enzyme